MKTQCPDESVLRRYVVGRTAPQTSALVERHLRHCSQCQAVAEHLNPTTDSLLACVRQSLAHDEVEQEEELAAVLSSVGDTLRWIEVQVESRAGLGSPHHELARLLVDQEKYNEGALAIERGWIEYEDETFEFDPQGDITTSEDGLWVLNKPLPADRVSVHDVLTLLFDAKFAESTEFGNLRHVISGMVLEAGPRKRTRKEIPLRNGRRVRGEVWSASNANKWRYTISRSRQVPFGFTSVILDMPMIIQLKTELVEFDDHDESLWPDEESIEQRAADTQRRIDAQSKENWRVWRDKETRIPIAWAEFGGRTNKGTWVLLWPEDGDEIERSIDTLSDADQEWIEHGRVWRDRTGRFLVRAQYNGRISDKVMLKTPERSFTRPVNDLSVEDQRWIELRKTRSRD